MMEDNNRGRGYVMRESSGSGTGSSSSSSSSGEWRKQTQLSALEHTLIGGLSGVVEVTIQQPTVTIKNALQEGRAIPWRSLQSMYRGWSIGALSMTPVNAVQFGSYKLIENAIINNKNKYGNHHNSNMNMNSDSDSQRRLPSAEQADSSGREELEGELRLVVSCIAGMVSALVSTPAETIVVQQQRRGSTLSEEVMRMCFTMSPANLYRGMVRHNHSVIVTMSSTTITITLLF